MGAPNTTPGPWHSGGLHGTIVYDPDGWAIADAKTFHRRHEDGAAVANAHQMAASPALYDALEKARIALIAVADSAAEAGFGDLANIIDERLSEANAALSLARGEQP